MQQEYAIEVKNITKSFKVYLDRSNNLKDFAIHSSRRKFENREVLKGISFKVKKGEAIGLVGRNGCGKSTTLKLLTRIMYPDTGEIKINGRVSSLIELGAGFHPDMSGRENIYINASIFGLSRKEIDKRVKKIIAFSELEDYIDNPVRTYSSGMYMRLAFSVAINVDADVLLIDEILAVGDANFQSKCFQKLRDIKESGTTIVIVSHALGQIESICERSIWIEDGKIKVNDDLCNFCGRCSKSCPTDAWEETHGYIVSFGGLFGNSINKGEAVIPFIEDHEKLLKVSDAAIEFFENHAKPGERFKFTIDRIGKEKFEQVIKEAYEND